MGFYACFSFLVAFNGDTEFSVNSATGLSTISPIKDELCSKIAANLNVSKKKFSKTSYTATL